MGAQITTDKHTTPIQDWIDIEGKIDSIDFQNQVNHHVSAWKFFNDQLNPQQHNSLPIQIDLTRIHQIFSPHQAYIICAIKCVDKAIDKNNASSLLVLINSIKQNIQKQSYQIPIHTQMIQNYSYAVYSYFGKLSKPKIRLVCLSFALKMKNILNSKNKLAILSSGGVLRKNKLQKGSTLPLLPLHTIVQQRQNIQQKQIHIFNYFWSKKSQNVFSTFQSNKSSPFKIIQSKYNKSVNTKPPMLKLSLKPFQQVTYNQIQQQQKTGQIKFDIRATARHELKMQKFQGQCSYIIQGLYVGGDKVSKSWQIFQKNNIKAVINCAGDYCENSFQAKGINYLTFFLKDSQNQNIQCLFYRAIDFITFYLNKKINVLVHCIQGISRSITIIIAYIIFKLGYDYKKAEHFVKQKRAIACPNNGFMVQLIQFYKRLYEEFNSLPNPRVFLVSSHSKQTPNLITARLLKSPLFDERKFIGLDTRAVYIVQVPDIVYIWVGAKCQDKRLQQYWNYAQQYVKKLQKYQRASLKVKAISQGTEGKEFLSIWNLQDSPLLYENTQYSRLFFQGQQTKPGGMRKYYEKQIQQQNPVKLYIYPDHQSGLGVFELQDLGSLNLIISPQDVNLKIFILRDKQYQEQMQVVGQFLDNVIRTHYNGYKSNNILIQEQNLQNPSQTLLQFFS